MFYSIGRHYRFGFDQSWFSRKVSGRNVCGCGGGGGQGGVDVLPQKRCIFVWGEKCAQEKVMDIFVIVMCCKYCVQAVEPVWYGF